MAPPTIQLAIASITALLDGAKADLFFIQCDFSALDDFAGLFDPLPLANGAA
jgi:hypothetical protein